MNWLCNVASVFYDLPLKWKFIAAIVVVLVVALITVPIVRYIVIGIYAVSIATFIAFIAIGTFERGKASH